MIPGSTAFERVETEEQRWVKLFKDGKTVLGLGEDGPVGRPDVDAVKREKLEHRVAYTPPRIKSAAG